MSATETYLFLLKLATGAAQIGQTVLLFWWVFWGWDTFFVLRLIGFFILEAIAAHVVAFVSTLLAAPALYKLSKDGDQ